MSAPTSPPLSRRQKNRQIECKVLLLDDTILTVHIPVKSSGQVLYDEVIRKLQLLEADYFDLEYVDVRHTHSWLDHDKPVLRQLPRHSLDLRFVVKFYTPDPGQLEEDYTRYLFGLQVRRDLASGALPCQEHTAVLLASYIVQAELGDFSDEFEVPGYLKDIKLLPRQTEELEQRIAEHHRDHVGQTPAVAEFNLLDTARKVDLYGIQTHPAKDHEGVPLHLAVAHLGVLVFQNQTKINTFSWAKIRKLSFKRKKFLVKLHPEGYGYYKDIVEFYFESRNDCKNFWKKCLEHHAFFRCHSVKRLPRNKTRLVSRGSSFRYCGRTQKQLAEYVRENCNRRPEFQRSTSMRTISLSHSVATTPKTGTLKSRGDHHLSHPNIRTSSSSHAICVERAHARERYKHGGKNDTAPTRSLQTFRAIGMDCDAAQQTLTPPGGTKNGADDSTKVRKAQMELRNGTLDDFNLTYFKSGYNSDKQSRDIAYHDNMSQDSYQLMESHDSLDFDRVEPVDGGAVDGNELCRQLEETREGKQMELENPEDPEEGTVQTEEESHPQSPTFVELDNITTKLVKDGEPLSDFCTVEKDGETVAEDGIEDHEGYSSTGSATISVRRKRLSRGEAVRIRDEETASPDYRATSSPGHKVTSSPGHEVTISPGHEVTGSPVHNGDDSKVSDVHEAASDSSENVPDGKFFQSTYKTADVQECASSSHEVSSSPGHKVTTSLNGDSSENLDKRAKVETVLDSVRSTSEAESHSTSYLTDSAALGQEVTKSSGHEANSTLLGHKSLEKSEVSAEHKTALEGSGDLADTLLPPGVGFCAELLEEQSKQKISEPIKLEHAEKLRNGQDETGDRKEENEINEDTSVNLHAGENIIAGTDSEFPYILHKRHLASKGEQTDIVVQNSSLSMRSFRSRSPSPGKKRTREEQKAELEKVKATLSSLAFQRKNPSVGNRRILDFVMYSKLPPRDSFSSKDDSISPTTLERALASKGKAGSGSNRHTKEKSRTGCKKEEPLPPAPAVTADADSNSETSAIKDKVDATNTVFAMEDQVESLNERTLDECLDAMTKGKYSKENRVGSDLTNLGAGELALDAHLVVETGNSMEHVPNELDQEFSSSLYIGGSRTSFPPNVVGTSMCSLEEFLMDVDLPAPIVESEEFDTSTSNSGDASVLEQSGRDEDVSPLEKENSTLEERLAQVILPPPPPSLEGAGVWNDDALNMELYEPPAMLELFVDNDGAGILPHLNVDYLSENCGPVDLFDVSFVEVSDENLERFGAESVSVGGRFTVDDLAVFDALQLTDDFFRVTSSPIPSPPPPPFPWCDDVENSADLSLSSSEPTVGLEKGLLRSFSCEERNPRSDMAVDKIIRIESSPVLRTSASGNLLAGKDPLDPVENNPNITLTLPLLSMTKLDQPLNLLPNEAKMGSASSLKQRREELEQVCSSAETIPLVRCSIEPGLSSGNMSETTHKLDEVATGHDVHSLAVFSDHLVHGDISDEDDVEKPYTEHSLHDLYRNLEAEALAKPFHVPISADIPLNVFLSDDISTSRSPDSYEMSRDSLGIAGPVQASFEEPLFDEPRFDDNVLDHTNCPNPSHVTVSAVVPCQSQTLSLQNLGSSSSQCSSTKP